MNTENRLVPPPKQTDLKLLAIRVFSYLLLAGLGLWAANSCNNERTDKETAQTTVARLKTDSSYWHGQANRYHILSDSLNTQALKATANTKLAIADRDKAQMVSDRAVDALNRTQAELDVLLTKRLVDNNTLSADYAKGSEPKKAVAVATIKTADRLAGQTKAFNDLAASAGLLKVQNEDQAKAINRSKLKVAKVVVYAQTEVLGLTEQKFPFGFGRKRAEKKVAIKIKRYAEVEVESELEKELNH